MGIRNRTQGPNFFEFFTQQADKLVAGVEILAQIYAASPEERVALRDQLDVYKRQCFCFARSCALSASAPPPWPC